MVMKYRTEDRDQLANLMLLSKEMNVEEKHSLPPDEWIQHRMSDVDKEIHLIPKDPALWKLERFDDFIEARKKLITEKFSALGLIQT